MDDRAWFICRLLTRSCQRRIKDQDQVSLLTPLSCHRGGEYLNAGQSSEEANDKNKTTIQDKKDYSFRIFKLIYKQYETFWETHNIILLTNVELTLCGEVLRVS